MLDKLIVFRTFISLAFLLLVFFYILVAGIRGAFDREALPYIIIALLLCVAIVFAQLLFLYL